MVYQAPALIYKRARRALNGVIQVEKHASQSCSVIIRHGGDLFGFRQGRYQSCMVWVIWKSVFDDIYMEQEKNLGGCVCVSVAFVV
jgi:hypothetical protein